MRPLIAHISRSALENNLAQFRQLAPNSLQCAVIKADAYGHRVENLLPTLEKSADYLAVAMIEEALEIRQLGGTLPIILLEGVFEPEEYPLAAHNNFHVVVGDERQLNWLKESTLSTPLSILLKVDTGMHRLGFNPEDVPHIYEQLNALPFVQSIMLMTHFACADERNSPLTAKQAGDMKQLRIIDAPQSIANSAALLTIPEVHAEMVRFGISLYGISPLDESTGKDFNLQPVLTLKSRIIHTMTINAGESVGYGAKFIAPETMPIGVVAGGYADCYPREISDEAYLLVGNMRAPIVGRPAMDMMMIDLRNIPQSKWDNPVTLFGEGLPLEYVAKWAGTIPYTILTHLAKRVHFEVEP